MRIVLEKYYEGNVCTNTPFHLNIIVDIWYLYLAFFSGMRSLETGG